MKFFTRVNRPPSPALKCGPSLVQPQFARDTDINVMIQRYLHGDASVLARHSGIISDATSLPDNLHDVLNIRSRGEYAWNQLPEQVRASYGNVERFLAAFESADRPVPPKCDVAGSQPSDKPVDKSLESVTPTNVGA